MGRQRMLAIVGLVCALSLLGAACTSAGDAAGDPPSATGDNQGDQGARGDKPGRSRFSPKPFKRKVRTYTGRLATATAVLKDKGGDAQVKGQVPGYVEIVSGSVDASSREVRLVLTMSGEVPQTMPDDATFFIVSWNLTGSKKAPVAGFTAQASSEGWQVSAALDNDVVEYPGTVEIDGNTVALVFPWTFIGGPHRFEWSAAASYSSSSGGKPAGSGDNITEGRYPPKRSGRG